jgi:hypothetical protein
MTPAEFPSFTKKFNYSTLTKRHVGDSHFIAVHDGYVRGAHALILHSCGRGKMLLIFLQIVPVLSTEHHDMEEYWGVEV